MCLRGVDRILGKRPLAPCVCTAHPMDTQVNIKVDETSARDVHGMQGSFKIFFAIVPGAYAQWLTGIYTYPWSLSFRAYFKPSDIASVSIVLRVDVFRLVLGNRHFIYAEEC